MQPIRIQRKRTEGYDMQVVSRAANGLPCISVTRPGRWGNPFSVERFGRSLSLELFRNSLNGVWNPEALAAQSDESCAQAYAAHTAFMRRFKNDHPLAAVRSELRGRNLSCYCSPTDACHADILIEIANQT